MERWKAIPEFPGYEASDLGRIRSFKRDKTSGRILRPAKTAYRNLNLRRDGQSHHFNVAELVLLAFVGPCPLSLEICHNDGNPHNDALDNLRYDTHKANMQDAIRHGRMVGNHGPKNIDNDQAKTIRIKYASGEYSQVELAKELELSVSIIHDVVWGRTHKVAGGPIKTETCYIPDDTVVEIRQAYATGELLRNIAAKYKVSIMAVSLIGRGKRRSAAPGNISPSRYDR